MLDRDPTPQEPDPAAELVGRPEPGRRTRVADAALAPPWVRAVLMGAELPDLAPTAEQSAAGLALRRTFGVPGDPGPVILAGVDAQERLVGLPASRRPSVAVRGYGAADPRSCSDAPVDVWFRIVRRDCSAVAGAQVTLLDGRGATVAGGVADPEGRGVLAAPHAGAYMLVASVSGDQPGAMAVTVGSAPVEVDVLVARSASVSGTVRIDGRPAPAAQITLVRDGEVVDMVVTEACGDYRLAELTGGEYALAIAADGCAPAVRVVTVPEEGDLVHDVDLAATDRHAEPAVPVLR